MIPLLLIQIGNGAAAASHLSEGLQYTVPVGCTSMPNTAPQRHTKTVTEVRNVAVDFLGLLDDGELLTGTPTVVEVTTTDLTLASKAVNATALTINGVDCIAGQAVTFKVSVHDTHNRSERRLACANVRHITATAGRR